MKKIFKSSLIFSVFLLFAMLPCIAAEWSCCELEELIEEHWEFQEGEEFMAVFNEGYRLGCW